MKFTAQPKKKKNALSKVLKKSKAKEHGKFSSADIGTKAVRWL